MYAVITWAAGAAACLALLTAVGAAAGLGRRAVRWLAEPQARTVGQQLRTVLARAADIAQLVLTLLAKVAGLLAWALLVGWLTDGLGWPGHVLGMLATGVLLVVVLAIEDTQRP